MTYTTYDEWISLCREAASNGGINNPENVYAHAIQMIDDFQREHFVAIFLNTKNKIISKEIVSIGSLNANIVHPREVFKPAIRVTASHIIIAHNHPSGDPTPSNEDIEITKKLIEAGKIIGIDILDHVIIGDSRHYSMKESGVI